MTYQKVRLVDCCVIKPPKAEARKVLAPDDAVSFVPMKSLGINKKGLVLDVTRKLADVSGSYTYFAENDVLLAKITPCFENGKLGIATGLINGIGFGSSEFIVFRPSENVKPEYLYYFLNQPSFRTIGKSVMTGAVGHKRVPKEFIENTEIPLPPIPEQKRIVAILDQAFADIDKSRANAEQNLKNARELFDSYLSQVSADKQPLGKYVTIKTGKLNSNASTENGAYPFFTCSRDIFSIDSYSFDCEAILLAGNNASGDFNVKHYQGKFDAYQRTYVITINNVGHLSYTYLYYQMIKSLRQLKNSSVGAGTKFLKIGMIENLEISIPPLSEQEKILDVLEPLKANVERLDTNYSRKLSNLDEFKKSILQKAFSGELSKNTGVVA